MRDVSHVSGQSHNRFSKFVDLALRAIRVVRHHALEKGPALRPEVRVVEDGRGVAVGFYGGGGLRQ